MKKSNTTKRQRIYAWRFAYPISRGISMCLLLALLLSPVTPIFASEENGGETAEPASPEPTSTETPETEPEEPLSEVEPEPTEEEQVDEVVEPEEENVSEETETQSETEETTVNTEESVPQEQEGEISEKETTESEDTHTEEETQAPATTTEEASEEDITSGATTTNESTADDIEESEGTGDTSSTTGSSAATTTEDVTEEEQTSTSTASTTNEFASSTDSVNTGGGGSSIETSDDPHEEEQEEVVKEEEVNTSRDEEQTDNNDISSTESEDTEDSNTGDGVEEMIDESATTTDSVLDTSDDSQGVIINEVTNDQNRFSFAKGECTAVGDGSFYCTKPTGEPTTINADRVFSAQDEDGDREIYIEKGSELSALTDNLYEDDAPFYDDISETIVWHRLIDGRYQIMVYDLEAEEEIQLTSDRYNNMQPTRFGDAIVWQGWVGDDWEIFLLENDELTMLTDNTVHDIAPSINGTHIVWQSFEAEVWQMKVYDINTGVIETIESSDGGSIQNPRFVLVYDTLLDTGDVETRGYDLKSKEVIPLSSEPAKVPDKIPEPDQTGEERALVAPTVQVKTKSEDEIDDEPEPDFDTDISATSTSDIVIPPHADTPETTVQSHTAPDSIEDLILEPQESSSTTIEHIEDVIVTPFVEQITDNGDEIASSTDSQETVAE